MRIFGNAAARTLLVVVLLLAPLIAALPDETLSSQALWPPWLSWLAFDQSFWSSWLMVLVMVTVLIEVTRVWRGSAPPAPNFGGAGENRAGGTGRNALLAFAALLGLALLSLFWRLAAQHSLAYLGLMLRGWATLATEFALFALCRRLARVSRAELYALVLAVIGAATVVALNGVAERLRHGLAGDWDWRVFSTSTPDYLACYLVMLLPVTAALLGAAIAGPDRSALFRLLWGLILLAQLACLFGTGSRFGLVSLAVGAGVFALALRRFRVERAAMAGPKNRWRPLAIIAAVVLIGAVLARPVANRLLHSPENSGAFRVWTWKGAARMAADNPLLGTGIGAWVDQYPRYALTGFTRLAHNGYLQIADECGLPALLALLATLGFVGATAWRGTSTSLTPHDSDPSWLTAVAPADDRLLLSSLLGGLAAGVVQNLIDSDWAVFFLGVAFWALAGLAVGLAERESSEESTFPPSRLRLLALGGTAAVVLGLLTTQGIGAFYNSRAQHAADPATAQLEYAQAMAWDPLNARYPGDLGYRVYARTGNLSAAETSLRAAAILEPNGHNFMRLASVLEAQGRADDARRAYQEGLRVDPNSLDLLLGAARLSAPDAAHALYRRVAALEDSPVGTVRAIGEITEEKFAVADAALGFQSAQSGDTAEAARFYERAARRIEAYAVEGGTNNSQRQVLSGYHPDPDRDARVGALYERTMKGWAEAAPADQKATLRGRAQDYAVRFRAILARDHAALGDDALAAGRPTEAEQEYGRAAEFLESYADEGGTQAAQRQGFANIPPMPETDAEMAKLYGHVMDALMRLALPGQQNILQERTQRYTAKFAALFPTR